MKVLKTATLAFLILIATVPSARGATPQDDCVFEENIKALELIKSDTELEYLNRVRAEAEVRRGILEKIIGCAVSETGVLKSKLELVQITDKEVSSLKYQLVKDLNGATEHYQNESKQISNLGIQGSKDLAKELLEWRMGNYTRLAGQVVNFITWANNQELVRVAESRLISIKGTVLNFGVQNELIDQAIKESEVSLKSAKLANQIAKQVMMEFQPPGVALNKIKESLDNLALVYKRFFEISETANKILPL